VSTYGIIIRVKTDEEVKAKRKAYRQTPENNARKKSRRERPEEIAHRRKRIAIFCDGDFWHGYRYGQKKRLAKKFWRDKIENNMRRDRRYGRKLRRDGWSVLRLWEHDIEKNPEKCMRKILAKFHSR
jgi:DNA mismatch endonuclease, patch repair protein